MVKMNMIYSEIAPKFRSRKAFIKEMEKRRLAKIQRGDFECDTDAVSVFLKSTNDYEGSFSRGLVGYGNLSHPPKYLSVADCMENTTWDLPVYRNAWVRVFIDYQFRFYKYEKSYLSNGSTSRKASITLHSALGDLVAMMAIFGNRWLFENAVKFTLDVFDRKLTGGDLTFLTQLFLLRLSEKFLGLVPREWLMDKYWGVDPRIEEPLFAELWSHWDDEDTEILTPILIQLLNRHTFQASRNNKDGGRDFDGYSEQYPLEVHFIFRLREWRGLTNPVLTHRLMEPPFDVLPEPMQELIFDEQTIQFVKKVREVFPDFDTIVNNAKIRDWKMLL